MLTRSVTRVAKGRNLGGGREGGYGSREMITAWY